MRAATESQWRVIKKNGVSWMSYIGWLKIRCTFWTVYSGFTLTTDFTRSWAIYSDKTWSFWCYRAQSDMTWVTNATYSVKVGWLSMTTPTFLADFVGESEMELSWILMLCWVRSVWGQCEFSLTVERLSLRLRSLLHFVISVKQAEIYADPVRSSSRKIELCIHETKKKNPHKW